MNVYSVTNRNSDKMEWIVEIPKAEFAVSPHNHRLYQDLMQCSSVAENLRALILVAEAQTQLRHETERAEVQNLLRVQDEKNMMIEDLQKQVTRLKSVAGFGETEAKMAEDGRFEYRTRLKKASGTS